MSATQFAIKKVVSTLNKNIVRVLLCGHIEEKFVSWAIMLENFGFHVAVIPSNPFTSKKQEIDLLINAGIVVFERDNSYDFNKTTLSDIKKFNPHIIFDDGGLLIEYCIKNNGEFPSILGAVEFTTSGHQLLSMLAKKMLPWPVMDVGLSYCKYKLSNSRGPGISTIAAFLNTTNVSPAGKRCFVAGFGAVGEDIAKSFHTLGSKITVFDRNVTKLVKAYFDGYEIDSNKNFIEEMDILISCSGSEKIFSSDDLMRLKDNAIVINVGCFANEVDIENLKLHSKKIHKDSHGVYTYTLNNGRHIHILANAEPLNLALSRGWPIEFIDLCFCLTTLCFNYILSNKSPGQLVSVPDEVEHEALNIFLKTR